MPRESVGSVGSSTPCRESSHIGALLQEQMLQIVRPLTEGARVSRPVILCFSRPCGIRSWTTHKRLEALHLPGWGRAIGESGIGAHDELESRDNINQGHFLSEGQIRNVTKRLSSVTCMISAVVAMLMSIRVMVVISCGCRLVAWLLIWCN